MGLVRSLASGAEDQSIRFGANPLLTDTLPQVPNDISFDQPYDPTFLTRREGYISLGEIPNPDAYLSRIGNKHDYYCLKQPGEDIFTLPVDCRVLLPALELAVSFETARSKISMREKGVGLIVRDYLFYKTEKAQRLHRDPENMPLGGIQHVYSYASNYPTVFPGHMTPKPFEMSCFTAASPHNKPEIPVLEVDEAELNPHRRVFVAIAVGYRI